MASENKTLEEEKQEEELNDEEKSQVKEEEGGEEDKGEEDEKSGEKEEEEDGVDEKEEKEDKDAEASAEKEEETEDKDQENKGESVENRKAKRGRTKKAEDSSHEREESSKKSVKGSTPRKKAKSEFSDKEPVTPSERPTRERKTVERYTELSGRLSASKPLSIEKGPGTQLKDIPNVAFKLSKRKVDSSLQMLHTILFAKRAKAHSLKRNIGQFSGYVWVENEEKQRTKIKEKLDKCVKEKLLDFCDILNIPISKAGIKKEELSVKLLEFLETPHATTDTLLAEKEKSTKRKRSTNKSVYASATSETPAKKQKHTSGVGEKRKPSSKIEDDLEVDDKVEPSDDDTDSKEENGEEIEDEQESKSEDESEEEEEEDEPKKQIPGEKSGAKKIIKKDPVTGGSNSKSMKKGSSEKASKSTKKSPSSAQKKRGVDVDDASTPTSKVKVPSTKKQKAEKDSENDQIAPAKEKGSSTKQSNKTSKKVLAKDKGKISKKVNVEPSREEMHAVVVDILKEVDFNTATLSDIIRQLGTHFGVDLMHRKSEVKAIITEVINNMSDEEDESGEEDEKDGKED